MSFTYLTLLKPNEHKKDYQKAHDKDFVFEIEDKIYIYVRENLVSFETKDKIANSSSEQGFNDIKLSFAYSNGNTYFLLHQKYVPIHD